MTEKEKALELIKKFDPMVYPFLGSGMLANIEDEDVILKNAKLCTVIALQEIIIALKAQGLGAEYYERVIIEVNNIKGKLFS